MLWSWIKRFSCFVPSEFDFRRLMKMVYCNTVDSKDLVLAFFFFLWTVGYMNSWSVQKFSISNIYFAARKKDIELDCPRHLAHSLAPKLSFTRRRWEISQVLPGPTLSTICGRSNFATFIYQRYNSIYMVKTESSFHINNQYMYLNNPARFLTFFAVALQLQPLLNSRLEKDIDIEMPN